MDILALIGNPLFGLTTTVITSLIGHYYYVKAKKDGAIQSRQYEKKLEGSRKEIADLNSKIQQIKKLAHNSNVTGDDILRILELKSSPGNEKTSQEVWDPVMSSILAGNIQEAALILAGQKDKIEYTVWNCLYGYIKYASQDYKTAEKHFRVAVTSDNEYLQYWAAFELGRIIYNQKGNILEAIEYLDMAHQLRPDEVMPLLRKATCLLEVNDFDGTDSIIDKVYSKHPDNSELWMLMMRREEKKLNYKGVIELAPKVLAVSQKPKEVYERVATAYSNLAQYDNAEEWAHKALLLDPEAASTLTLVANIYAVQGKLVEAEMIVTKLLTLHAGNGIDIFHVWALIKNRQRKYVEVIKYAKSFNFSKNLLAYHTAICLVVEAYLSIREYEQAKILLEELLSGYPTCSRANWLLGKYYKFKPEPDLKMAVNFLTNASTNAYAGDKVYLLSEIAEIYLSLGDKAQARVAAEHALDIAPDSQDVVNLYHRVMG